MKHYWLASSFGLGLVTQLCPAPVSAEAIAPPERSPNPHPTSGDPSLVDNSVDITPQPEWSLAEQDFVSSAEVIPLEAITDESMAQVTSVSELTDVQPSDWAFQALKSLVERYGVLGGYADGTFRGDRPLTRYEFAAALDAVLDRLNDLISDQADNQLLREDFLTAEQLQATYGSALADLRDRTTDLDDRGQQLEYELFSATTKLQGQTVLAPTIGTADGGTLVAQTRLNLLTSFQGSDLLLTQLEMGNEDLDAIAREHNRGENLLGTQGILADGGGLEAIEGNLTPRIRRLYYSFQPVPSVAIAAGAKLVPSDFIDRNQFANNPAIDFSSSFFSNNPLIVQNPIDQAGGAGVAVSWQVGQLPLTLRSLYIAANAEQPQTGGLFGDRKQGSVELEYTPNSNIAVRLQYTSALINNTAIEAGGVNAEWLVNRTVGLFGRYGFGTYRGFNTVLGRDLELDPQTWALGGVLRNWLIPGTLAGFAVGQPFVESDLGNGTQTNYEVFYNLAINDHFSLAPTFMLVTDPNNNDDSNSIWQATVRTLFSF